MSRPRGTPKKKSIKAAMHPGWSSKRKLSRMGKNQKKHHGTLDATFIGRSAVLRKLQINLKDFRRLCILKGIYPREPRKSAPHKKKGQILYHLKDVKAIAHEPILEKFREFKAFMKKVRRVANRQEKDEAKRKYLNRPSLEISRLVKERYPRFVDALSDLDDALALCFLYASLPSSGKIKTSITRKAKELASGWGAYCAVTNSITKSFISVKGVYMEACIQNIPIRWIIPHSFTQSVPKDVDYRVMATFFEFYETLLEFVLFKLYHSINVKYPFTTIEPMVNHGSSTSLLSAHLQVLNRVFHDDSHSEITQAITPASEKKNMPKVQKTKTVVPEVLETIMKANDDDDSDDDDEHVDIEKPLATAFQSLVNDEFNSNEASEKEKKTFLFSGLCFFLSREVPRGYLELTILSFGGRVGWDGDDTPISQKDKCITHHVIDRPENTIPSSFFESLPSNREFIQPQWIVDCANFTFLLPPSRYGIGKLLPPHLSPWINPQEEGYKPLYAQEIENLKKGIHQIPEKEETNINEQIPTIVDTTTNETDDSSDNEDEADKETSDNEEEQDDDIQDEKETEVKNLKQNQENKELALLMMNRKAKSLYGRMQYGIARKQAKVDNLERKRKDLESTKLAKKENSKDKTIKKQKVERLKRTRKNIVKKYE